MKSKSELEIKTEALKGSYKKLHELEFKIKCLVEDWVTKRVEINDELKQSKAELKDSQLCKDNITADLQWSRKQKESAEEKYRINLQQLQRAHEVELENLRA